MGCVVSANVGQAPARQAALGAGLRESTVCTTINKVCASGLKAVGLGVQSIMLGYHGIVLAGGMESMSRAPFYVDARRGGLRFGDNTITDALLKDGLWDPKYQIHMGVCAEETAKKYGIGREAQDAFARKSYERASDASCTGKFKSEICSVGAVVEDEEYKRVNFDKMLQLKPAFDPSGTITAGNASSLSDGAAAVLLCSKGVMEEKKISRPLARVLSIADSEGNPKEFSTMPSVAIPLALKRAGLSIADVSLFEINEAFSVVVLANQQVNSRISALLCRFCFRFWVWIRKR
jgi:acetyl-CoA C-acetyltransferase